MNKTYVELNAMAPEMFLNPDNFVTDYDAGAGEYKRQQYQHGLEISRQAKQVAVGMNGTWSAEMLGGSFLSSSEGIGYHSCTADLLRGFLDGPAEIVVYRWVNGHCERFVIRAGK